jgi:NitT/TauT family transport system substrate-binding protein
VASSGGTVKVLPWSEFGLQGYNWSLITSDKMIKEHPETVAKFLRAFKKSVDYVTDHPNEAGKDLHDMVPDTDAAANAAEIKAMIPLVRNEISAKYGLGAFDPGLVTETWKWVYQSQDLDSAKIDPQSVVDRSFVPRS